MTGVRNRVLAAVASVFLILGLGAVAAPAAQATTGSVVWVTGNSGTVTVVSNSGGWYRLNAGGIFRGVKYVAVAGNTCSLIGGYRYCAGSGTRLVNLPRGITYFVTSYVK